MCILHRHLMYARYDTENPEIMIGNQTTYDGDLCPQKRCKRNLKNWKKNQKSEKKLRNCKTI